MYFVKLSCASADSPNARITWPRKAGAGRAREDGIRSPIHPTQVARPTKAHRGLTIAPACHLHGAVTAGSWAQ